MAGFTQAQLFDSGTSTWTAACERGAPEEVSKNSSGTFVDVRTVSKDGQLKEALRISADSNAYVSLLQKCIKSKDLERGKQVHSHIIVHGFKPTIFLLHNLLNMYAKCGSLVEARQVFDEMPERTLFTWTIMMTAYAKHGYCQEALKIYEQMQQEGVTPDRVTFTCILNACASLGALEKGKEVHADISKNGIALDMILENTLVDMYAKCRSMKDAREVFDKMAKRDVISWSAMIAGYAQHGNGSEAFKIYEQMTREGVMPTRVTFISILKACAGLGALEKGTEVHANIIKAGIAPDIILQTALLDMYAKSGSIKDARRLFDKMPRRNVVSWSAMIAGYTEHGDGREALKLYGQMLREGVTPNKVTFISVLNACASLADLGKGKEVHEDVITAGIASYVNLDNTLVDMYAKCGSINDARQVFDKMTKRNMVSYNAMITGYAQHGFGGEALEIYEQMIQGGLTPDKVTFICVLNACASLAALEKGKEVHADVITAGISPYVNLENALLNMYAKCGRMNDAQQVFDNMVERDVVSWSVMIAGYGQHGCGREALRLFDQMQLEGLKPDGITFLSLLSACSHGGLVDEGRHCFDSMCRHHGVTPTMEHFSCMVDLLGRAGRLDEAEDFVKKMSIEPGASVWGALLGACRIHGNVELAERAAKCVLKLDPQNIASYVLLSNIYAAAGRWEDQANVEKMIEERCRKVAGVQFH